MTTLAAGVSMPPKILTHILGGVADPTFAEYVGGMSQLTIGTYTMPAATLGGENPLPPLEVRRTLSDAELAQREAMPDYPDKGNEANSLPYLMLSNYDRVRRPRAFKAIVLENEILQAMFLPELGGHMWSLIHKPSGRQLLHVNPAFQPANLALRDAWISGGVEWNIGIISHCAFTCSSVFAAKVIGDGGTPVLRLYEFERIRQAPFQVNCWLPDGSPMLMVRVRIINPHDRIIPMYWWSNIAADERKDVRVLSPAVTAYRHTYDGKIVMRDVPVQDGIDVTYPTNRPAAGDVYYRIDEGHRPWIAALDANGQGLVHTSTSRLRGRKLWAWGMGRGGRRWQEFLAEPGAAYIEIQGGLARTQAEYVAMPPKTEWDWLEAYGMLSADGKVVHGEWKPALEHAERKLEEMLPREKMDRVLSQSAAMADREPAEMLHLGSGWGALERRRREVSGERPMCGAALPFPDASLNEEQAMWLSLLQGRPLPYRQPSQDPGAIMVQQEWRDMLEGGPQSALKRELQTWMAWYHLGIMRHRAGDKAGAAGMGAVGEARAFALGVSQSRRHGARRGR